MQPRLRKPTADECALTYHRVDTRVRSAATGRAACDDDRAPPFDVHLEVIIRSAEDPHVVAGEISGRSVRSLVSYYIHSRRKRRVTVVYTRGGVYTWWCIHVVVYTRVGVYTWWCIHVVMYTVQTLVVRGLKRCRRVKTALYNCGMFEPINMDQWTND